MEEVNTTEINVIGELFTSGQILKGADDFLVNLPGGFSWCQITLNMYLTFHVLHVVTDRCESCQTAMSSEDLITVNNSLFPNLDS